MKQLFGAKKAPPPEVKAPSLQEVSGTVYNKTTIALDLIYK